MLEPEDEIEEREMLRQEILRLNEAWEEQMLKDIEFEKQREHDLKVKAVTDFVKAYERQKFGGDVGVTFYLIRYLKELEHKKAAEDSRAAD